MACKNYECQYRRMCWVQTDEVYERFECADYCHFDDMANDARLDRMHELEEENYEDDDFEEEEYE